MASRSLSLTSFQFKDRVIGPWRKSRSLKIPHAYCHQYFHGFFEFEGASVESNGWLLSKHRLSPLVNIHPHTHFQCEYSRLHRGHFSSKWEKLKLQLAQCACAFIFLTPSDLYLNRIIGALRNLLAHHIYQQACCVFTQLMLLGSALRYDNTFVILVNRMSYGKFA